MTNEHQEIRADRELRSALRSIEPEPPLESVDWDALRSSIVSRAELPLARRRARSARLSHWSRPLVPLAAAASIALAFWFGDFLSQTQDGPSIVDAAPELFLPGFSAEDLFDSDLTDQEFQLLVSGRANSDALLLVAIGGS